MSGDYTAGAALPAGELTSGDLAAETTARMNADVAHTADTTGVHGIADTAALVRSIVEGTGVTVDATDPANPVVSATGGGGGGGDFLPIADPAGAVIDTTTYDNQITGSGKVATVVFPAETTMLAWAIEGDAHPRGMIGVDPDDYGFVFLGNGVVDLLSNSAGTIGFGNPGLYVGGGLRTNGDVNFSSNADGPILRSRTTGTPFRLVVLDDAGTLGTEQII